jgi:hypothetical protein
MPHPLSKRLRFHADHSEKECRPYAAARMRDAADELDRFQTAENKANEQSLLEYRHVMDVARDLEAREDDDVKAQTAATMLRELWAMYVGECTRHQVTIEEWANEIQAGEAAMKNLIKRKREYASDFREGRIACSHGGEHQRADDLDAQADELECLIEGENECHV